VRERLPFLGGRVKSSQGQPQPPLHWAVAVKTGGGEHHKQRLVAATESYMYSLARIPISHPMAMKSFPISLTLLALSGLLLMANPAPAQGIHVGPGTDLQQLLTTANDVRMSVKAQKRQIIGNTVFFKEDEATRFWPLFDQYLGALDVILDERVVLLQMYAENFHKMDDKPATTYFEKLFELEDRQTKLKRTWFKNFSKAVTAHKAAQVFQIENQINRTLDEKLFGSLPRIQ
jgi:hemerythrin superfamily protein